MIMRFLLDIQFFGTGRSKAGGGGTSGKTGAKGGGAADTEPTVTATPEEDRSAVAFDPSTASLDELYAQEYHTFKDKASYSHEYEGSGADVVKFFDENSNYDEVIKGMNERQIYAFNDYWCPGMFMGGEQYRGWDGMTSEERHMTSRMDHVLDKSVLYEGVVVTRLATAELVLGKGHTRGTMEALSAMEGRDIFSKGAMSCGAAAEGLTIGHSKNVEYKIHIPKGSKGAGMWIGDQRINFWGARQREFVVNRDSTFKVGKTRYNSSRKVYEVDIFYTGQMEHDYGSSPKRPRR